MSEAATNTAPETAPLEGKPFAQDTAGKEYFDSESHYRLLAAKIRNQLQVQADSGGVVLVTGSPAPNADLLVRQLVSEGSPRYRATMIKGTAQTSAEGLLNSYRTQLGISLAEETLKLAAGSTQPMSPTRRNDVSILVLDNAEALSFDVLEEFCLASSSGDEFRPPLILVASEAINVSLAAKSATALNAAITARFELHHLTDHEIASFIGFQMKAANLDHLNVFKPPILELIDIYADGDPSVVNGLARRVLNASPRSVPAPVATQDIAASPEEAPRAEVDSAIAENVAVLREEEGTASKHVGDTAPDNEIETLAPESFPVSPEEVEAVVLGGPFVPSKESSGNASAYYPVPVEELRPVGSGDAPAGDEELSIAAIETSPAPLADTMDPEIFVVDEEDEDPAEYEVDNAPPDETIAASNPEPDLIFATSDDLDIAEPPREAVAVGALVVDAVEDRFRSGAEGEDDTPIKRRSRIWPRMAAFSVIAALAVAALVVGFRTGFLRSAESLQLQAYVQTYVEPYIASFRQFVQDLTHRAPTSNATPVQVAKDPVTQPLRTTTKESNTDLLLEPDPTDLGNTTKGKNAEPPTISLPPKAPTPIARPEPSPPTVIVPAPPAVAVVPPFLGQAPVATVEPPAPPVVVLPPSPVVTKAVGPTKRDIPASPVLVAPPPQGAAARTASNADSALLLSRGDQLLASGDIIAARHYFEMVAEAGDLHAALRLGKTYDPAFLKQIGARGIAGNPALAKSWYLKAIASGDKDADLRLLQLMALYPE